MSMIEDGLAMLNEAIEEAASEEFTYVRGADSFTFSAMLGRPIVVPVAQGAGPPPDPNKSERDFIPLASALAINGTPILPAAGDEIRETITGLISQTVYRYKVSQPSAGGALWSYVDGYRGEQARIVIHTKYFGTL